jgi:Holliday junction resolvase RusA-like endonuclease
MITELNVSVRGRPAPQGSKHRGPHGQLREASPYLPAWRTAVRRAVYEEYKARGIAPADLPLFRGAVAMGITLWLPADSRVDGKPDLDKLIRGVWDALTLARVWEDDSRVTEILWASKLPALGGIESGADVLVRSVTGTRAS